MKTYFIDGNNLFGKIKTLKNVRQTDRQGTREKLAIMLDRFFAGKNIKLFLFYDGFENLAIRAFKSKIIYSQNKTADELIKYQIEKSKNPRQITLVSSDSNLIQFARKCGCDIIKSEEFAGNLSSVKKVDIEDTLSKSIDPDEIKKLFGL
jgi:predicted RNA-binding protein with PIN domain